MAGRVVVIGAGSSGLTAIKCLKDAGFSDIVCYERRDVIGGLWYFKEGAANWVDEACVNRSTVINTSKEFMAFSDFPMPENFPNFCHNKDVDAYFNIYSKNFDLEKYIQFNTEVLSLTKHNTYNTTGRWELKVKNHKSGEETTEVFDFTIVANGHHGEPSVPKFPGLDKFKGVTMHSKDFKDLLGVSGKRAIVVGIGNSGGDCCVELSKYMKAFLATRRGAWIMTRLVKGGMPWDYYAHSRFHNYKNQWLSHSYRSKVARAQLNEKFNHDLYHMTPVHAPDATHPTGNDELPNRIAAGMVVVKTNISCFTETGVFFEDGSFEDNIDLVIFATGYKVGYTFIGKDVLDIQNNRVEMFRNMFVPDLPKQTIAFLAVCQPLGAMFPIAEMQSRLAALVFKGAVILPSSVAMKKDIEKHTSALQGRYVQTARHTIQVDWLPFMDELAVLVGCKPNLLKLLLTDPVLFYHVSFGPGVPYQYRLHGPNPWPGARDAILTTLDRIKKPFETRALPDRGSSHSRPWFAYLVLTVATAAAAKFGLKYATDNDVDLTKFIPARLRF